MRFLQKQFIIHPQGPTGLKGVEGPVGLPGGQVSSLRDTTVFAQRRRHGTCNDNATTM